MKTKFQALMIGALLSMTSTAFAQISLAPLAKDQAHTVLFVEPFAGSLNSAQKESIAKVRADVETIGNAVLPSLISQMGTALAPGSNVKSIFADTAKSLKTKLGPTLAQINPHLPKDEKDALYVTTYILPWYLQKYPTIPTIENPLFGTLQFENFDWKATHATEQNDLTYLLSKSIEDAIKAAQSGEDLTLITAALHIRLLKDHIAIRLQIMSAVKPLEREFKQVNDQVELSTLTVPSDAKWNEYPIALSTMTVELQKEDLPALDVEFGSYNRISDGKDEAWIGQLRLRDGYVNFLDYAKYDETKKDEADCQMKLNNIPTLSGHLASQPTGNKLVNSLLGALPKPMPVKFRIARLSFDPETLRISSMKVFTQVTNTNLAQCLVMKDISDQFRDEANAAIEEQVKALFKRDDITDQLMSELYK